MLDQVLAALELEGGARKLIHSLKYHNVKDAGRICAQIIFQSVLLPDFDLVTAVPLHRKRESQRGYNQAEVIARYLARFSNRPYIDAIKRTVFTAPQAKTIAKSERLKKLENAFSLNLPVSIIKGKTVLLVDDVATTGTTLNECAKILRQNGAKMVCAVVVAHGG